MRVTGQGSAAVIRLVDDRATGFGSGCRSPANPERLQTVCSSHSVIDLGRQQLADSESTRRRQEADLRRDGPAGQSQHAATAGGTRSRPSTVLRDRPLCRRSTDVEGECPRQMFAVIAGPLFKAEPERASPRFASSKVSERKCPRPAACRDGLGGRRDGWLRPCAGLCAGAASGGRGSVGQLAAQHRELQGALGFV